MRKATRLLAILAIVIAVPAVVAAAQDETEPRIVKGKFELPLNVAAVMQEWEPLGYSSCEFATRLKGWSVGGHTHPWYALAAGRTGRVEIIIEGRRFVLEPGDELYHPKNAVTALRNLNDGPSNWFYCSKPDRPSLARGGS